MVNQVGNKFTWVIKNYSSLSSDIICSGDFVLDGYKWRIFAFPRGNYESKSKKFSLVLEVADYESLSLKRIHARYLLTIVNQEMDHLSIREENRMWFDQTYIRKYSLISLPISILQVEDGGFLVNDQVKVEFEVEVLEVVDRLQVETQQPLKKIKLESHDLQKVISYDVNGFQVVSSQVDFVRRVFENHPDIALEFRPKNPVLKTAYMNILLSLIEILRQSPLEMSKEDLDYAYGLLVSTKDAGFKVDWLEKKLKEVSEKKEKEEAYKTRIKEIAEEVKEKDEAYKTRMKELVEELKDLEAKMLANNTAPLTLDDGF